MYLHCEFRQVTNSRKAPDIISHNLHEMRVLWDTFSQADSPMTRNLAMLALLHYRDEILNTLPAVAPLRDQLLRTADSQMTAEMRGQLVRYRRWMVLVDRMYKLVPQSSWPDGLPTPRWMPRLVSKFRTWFDRYSDCTGELMGIAINSHTRAAAAVQELEDNLTAFPGTFEFALKSATSVARGGSAIAYSSKRRQHREAILERARFDASMDDYY